MSIKSNAALAPHTAETARHQARAPTPARLAGLVEIEAARGRAQFWPERRVVVIRHRGASNLPLTVKVPIDCYKGVTVDIAVAGSGCLAEVRVLLAHDDPDLEVPLYIADHDDDLVAEWRRWARDLALPLLMRTDAGDVDAMPRLGQVAIGTPGPRRARRAFLRRRPRAPRRAFHAQAGTIHARERELFATTR